MATRTIKTLGKTGRLSRATASKVAQKVRRQSKSRHTPKAPLSLKAKDTATGKGLIRFRVGTTVETAPLAD